MVTPYRYRWCLEAEPPSWAESLWVLVLFTLVGVLLPILVGLLTITLFPPA